MENEDYEANEGKYKTKDRSCGMIRRYLIVGLKKYNIQ